MAAADSHTVAKLLRGYAQRTALCGGNPYRAKALQTKILQNLAIAKSGEGRLHLHRAALLDHAKISLQNARPDLKHVTIAGDFRRGCGLVADLALVAQAPTTQDTGKRGFQYFRVADHSKSAHYAGGLSLEQIQQQHREADRLHERPRFGRYGGGSVGRSRAPLQ